MAFLRRLVAPATQHLHPRCLTASRGPGAPSNQSSLHPEALGFSSPGNTGISQEMKEAGQPQKDRENDEATHKHNYSEKMRFDNRMYSNAETVGKSTTAADGGDTGPERTLPETGEDKNETPQPQTKVGSDEEKTAERVQEKESNTKPTDDETDRHVMDYSR